MSHNDDGQETKIERERESPGRTIPTPSNRGWISQHQLAALLGKEYRTILKWRKQGRFHFIMVGGQVRIYEDEVRYLLDNGTRPIADSPTGEPDA